jgi:precorrin-6A synthase
MPTRNLTLIGIGAGDPTHVTVQAVDAINRTDVFFVVTKSVGDELTALRTQILERYARHAHRVVTVTDPPRRRGGTPAEQEQAVAEWRAARRAQYAELFDRELAHGERGAFLAWGDPALYESTLTILQGLDDVEVDVVPGISAISALTAAHRISLNRVGRPVHITTGRRLAQDGMTADDVVVMLDADGAFTGIDEDVDIYWGAYLGTPDELLLSGPLREIRDELAATRAAAKDRKGWMFDTYLLRRR